MYAVNNNSRTSYMSRYFYCRIQSEGLLCRARPVSNSYRFLYVNSVRDLYIFVAALVLKLKLSDIYFKE